MADQSRRKRQTKKSRPSGPALAAAHPHSTSPRDRLHTGLALREVDALNLIIEKARLHALMAWRILVRDDDDPFFDEDDAIALNIGVCELLRTIRDDLKTIDHLVDGAARLDQHGRTLAPVTAFPEKGGA